ncbi:MAG: DUF4474 domain-containing protein [Eubacteriales bacterium]|nr:DUF4474 domain-containing protein [Eubacteriales bacterium]MDD3198785.1 DUF4474 domain-containing protein [Eubacteriales bacterium]MDD4121635.1 DUF4474 domain-containing protein [Eubacteriales bacterium]MDD4628969.1 DUF4474 domain-containing protein [Eubacteriales bacterium]
MFDIFKTQLGTDFLLISSIIVLLIIFAFFVYRILRNLHPKPSASKTDADIKEFKKLLGDAGYAYDPCQDIFYSRIDAWQKKFGYCRLYDEAAAPSGMIIDSEPITFEYAGKRWLIQLWKGQYYLNTGAEIGVYLAEGADLSIPNLFNGTFYRCADKAEQPHIAFSLIKNDSVLFHREGKHWWLTGFMPGKFSEPEELSMHVRITFNNTTMCMNFIKGMIKNGYPAYEILTNGISVEFMFDKTHTPQPLTRTEETDWIIQRNNERICNRFMEITGEYDCWHDKLRAIREKEPLLYEALMTFGKTRIIVKPFDQLKKYL